MSYLKERDQCTPKNSKFLSDMFRSGDVMVNMKLLCNPTLIFKKYFKILQCLRVVLVRNSTIFMLAKIAF